MLRKISFVLVGLAIALFVVGCSSSSTDDDSGKPADSSTAESLDAPPTPAALADAVGCADGTLSSIGLAEGINGALAGSRSYGCDLDDGSRAFLFYFIDMSSQDSFLTNAQVNGSGSLAAGDLWAVQAGDLTAIEGAMTLGAQQI